MLRYFVVFVVLVVAIALGAVLGTASGAGIVERRLSLPGIPDGGRVLAIRPCGDPADSLIAMGDLEHEGEWHLFRFKPGSDTPKWERLTRDPIDIPSPLVRLPDRRDELFEVRPDGGAVLVCDGERLLHIDLLDSNRLIEVFHPPTGSTDTIERFAFIERNRSRFLVTTSEDGHENRLYTIGGHGSRLDLALSQGERITGWKIAPSEGTIGVTLSNAENGEDLYLIDANNARLVVERVSTNSWKFTGSGRHIVASHRDGISSWDVETLSAHHYGFNERSPVGIETWGNGESFGFLANLPTRNPQAALFLAEADSPESPRARAQTPRFTTAKTWGWYPLADGTFVVFREFSPFAYRSPSPLEAAAEAIPDDSPGWHEADAANDRILFDPRTPNHAIVCYSNGQRFVAYDFTRREATPIVGGSPRSFRTAGAQNQWAVVESESDTLHRLAFDPLRLQRIPGPGKKMAMIDDDAYFMSTDPQILSEPNSVELSDPAPLQVVGASPTTSVRPAAVLSSTAVSSDVLRMQLSDDGDWIAYLTDQRDESSGWTATRTRPGSTRSWIPLNEGTRTPWMLSGGRALTYSLQVLETLLQVPYNEYVAQLIPMRNGDGAIALMVGEEIRLAYLDLVPPYRVTTVHRSFDPTSLAPPTLPNLSPLRSADIRAGQDPVPSDPWFYYLDAGRLYYFRPSNHGPQVIADDVLSFAPLLGDSVCIATTGRLQTINRTTDSRITIASELESPASFVVSPNGNHIVFGSKIQLRIGSPQQAGVSRPIPQVTEEDPLWALAFAPDESALYLVTQSDRSTLHIIPTDGSPATMRSLIGNIIRSVHFPAGVPVIATDRNCFRLDQSRLRALFYYSDDSVELIGVSGSRLLAQIRDHSNPMAHSLQIHDLTTTGDLGNARTIVSSIGSRPLEIRSATLADDGRVFYLANRLHHAHQELFAWDDSPTSYDTWATEHLGAPPAAMLHASNESNHWGRSADPDRDGADNQLEYFTGTDPARPESQHRAPLFWATTPEHAELRYAIGIQATLAGARAIPERSSDLTGWVTSNDSIHHLVETTEQQLIFALRVPWDPAQVSGEAVRLRFEDSR